MEKEPRKIKWEYLLPVVDGHVVHADDAATTWLTFSLSVSICSWFFIRSNPLVREGSFGILACIKYVKFLKGRAIIY